MALLSEYRGTKGFSIFHAVLFTQQASKASTFITLEPIDIALVENQSKIGSWIICGPAMMLLFHCRKLAKGQFCLNFPEIQCQWVSN